ncbi:6-bladed beta-propeller [Parabacteroides sp. OttesenSCG-928-G07]|nr:6-bladed beta-propeller [Parabacteroides sp. OttesenSCG-928-G21]MDL2277557.1 6-bladed beta-propeller [Parabacteroides sp. OttesenSCG-928-G07]
MKSINSILCILAIYLIVNGCNSSQPTQGDIIQIDVTKNYPEKEIKLTDIADISYIQLSEEDEDYLFEGFIATITQNTIVVFSNRTGDFFFFGKDGKPKSRFNRKGNGPEEYVSLLSAVYDEQTDELFVYDMKMIRVYSSAGEYKRSLFIPKETWIGELRLFDDTSLLLYDNYDLVRFAESSSFEGTEDEPRDNKNAYVSPFVRISRVDGSVLENIKIPQDFTIDLAAIAPGIGAIGNSISGIKPRMTTYQNGVLLNHQEMDTIYLYDKSHRIIPVLTQTPSVKTTTPKVYINWFFDPGKYQFFEITKAIFVQGGPLQSTYLMRDKQDGSIYQQKLLLEEFKGKEFFITHKIFLRMPDYKIGHFNLNIDELREAYADNKLSGQLKEMMASMSKEKENDIIVLLQFK